MEGLKKPALAEMECRLKFVSFGSISWAVKTGARERRAIIKKCFDKGKSVFD
jgi:aryl-alcohol dehydrogenase-like predicted oxidoreductase